MFEQAKEKLERELKESSGGDRHESYLRPYVAKALINFAEKNDSFAERIVASKETLSVCVKEVVDAMDNKQAMSDFDVYKAAAQFYFPECEVIFNMEIREPSKNTVESGIRIDLSDFFN